MKTTGKKFQINYRGQIVLIEIFTNAHKNVYKVDLSSPIFVTETLDGNNNPFWTSVPEGRLNEAKEIGAFIEKEEAKPKTQTQTLF
jgi:hypothetical protein